MHVNGILPETIDFLLCISYLSVRYLCMYIITYIFNTNIHDFSHTVKKKMRIVKIFFWSWNGQERTTCNYRGTTAGNTQATKIEPLKRHKKSPVSGADRGRISKVSRPRRKHCDGGFHLRAANPKPRTRDKPFFAFCSKKSNRGTPCARQSIQPEFPS